MCITIYIQHTQSMRMQTKRHEVSQRASYSHNDAYSAKMSDLSDLIIYKVHMTHFSAYNKYVRIHNHIPKHTHTIMYAFQRSHDFAVTK